MQTEISNTRAACKSSRPGETIDDCCNVEPPTDRTGNPLQRSRVKWFIIDPNRLLWALPNVAIYSNNDEEEAPIAMSF